MRRPPLRPSTPPSIRSIDCGTNEGLASEPIVAALGGRSWGFLPSVLADSLRLPPAVHHRVDLRGVGAPARGERLGRVEERVPHVKSPSRAAHSDRALRAASLKLSPFESAVRTMNE